MAAATATKEGTCLHFRFPVSLDPAFRLLDCQWAGARDRKDLPRFCSSALYRVAFRNCLSGIFF